MQEKQQVRRKGKVSGTSITCGKSRRDSKSSTVHSRLKGDGWDDRRGLAVPGGTSDSFEKLWWGICFGMDTENRSLDVNTLAASTDNAPHGGMGKSEIGKPSLEIGERESFIAAKNVE